MFRRLILSSVIFFVVWCTLFAGGDVYAHEESPVSKESSVSKVYVPYDKLKDVFEKEGQGVFLSYSEFDKLWRSAQGKPADVLKRPFDFLISRAKFVGKISGELGVMNLALTVDILADGWVQVPIGLGEVAVDKVSIADAADSTDAKAKPLLRVANGQYYVLVKGKGRYQLSVDFVRQLKTTPGLHVLNYKMPPSAMTTVELLIYEENMKVAVNPMLAATTTQVQVDGKKATKLQAFLSASKNVELSWKPTTEAAAELEPVIVCKQYQHIDVGEAIVSYTAKLDYTIHRGGVDSFTVQLPLQFRVTEVNGSNIAKWGVAVDGSGPNPPRVQILRVKLFSPAKGNYTLNVKMERFLQESKAKIDLVAIVTQQALRRSGLIGVTHSSRRVVFVEGEKNLGRVDTGRLPAKIRNETGVTAWYFNTSDYGGTLAIETAVPRISVDQKWVVGVDTDRRYLNGKIHYNIERTGIFELEMSMPAGWDVQSVKPDSIVDDFQVKGEGDDRLLHVLLKKEHTGGFDIVISARADRKSPTEAIDFTLPRADKGVQFYSGQVVLALAEQLRAEVENVDQMKSIPMKSLSWQGMSGLSGVMAYEFKAIDRDKPSGAKFKIAVKPSQVSAIVNRLVDIKPGSITHQAKIRYHVQYAPVDTFYFKITQQLADDVNIEGENIKEYPRLPEPIKVDTSRSDEKSDYKWVYYKVVLHSKVSGNYDLTVTVNKSFKAGQTGKPEKVDVYPILAAGDIAFQNGFVAVKKADRLAIGEPKMKKLLPGDPSSSRDIPNAAYRKGASLAFKYTEVPYSLSLPVVTQKEGSVFTTLADSVIVEQVVTRDGLLNTRCMFLLATSQGDRLPVMLPKGAKLTAVMLDGQEIQVEQGMNAQERIVRLRPSAGQITRSVLELAYTVEDASAGNLVAASLPDEIPVQQTLWRVWMPNEWYLLAHDRMFSQLPGHPKHPNYGGNQIVNNFRIKYGSNVGFKLSGQGRLVTFARQGSADSLSLTTMGKETFTILVWVAIILAGVVMCWISGYKRVLVIVTIALALGILNLFMPLMVQRLAMTGFFAVCLVAVLWFAQWVFKKLPQMFKRVNLRKKTGVKFEVGTAKTEVTIKTGGGRKSDETAGDVIDASANESNVDADEQNQSHSTDVVNEARRVAKAARDKLDKNDNTKKTDKKDAKDNEDNKEGSR